MTQAKKRGAPSKAKGNWRAGRPKGSTIPGQFQTSVAITAETESAIRTMMHSFPVTARSRSSAIRYLCDSALQTGAHASYPREAARRVVELVTHYHPELGPLVAGLLTPLAERWQRDMLGAVPVRTVGVSTADGD